jgi:hypothetical protein
MKSLAVILATLSIGCNAAHAMGGPVYIDTICQTMREARATPELREWLKKQCPKGEKSPGVCADLAPFIRDVATNNENWRRQCGEGR